eukprot:359722-Chlamydomonas_euryale.AAC.3
MPPSQLSSVTPTECVLNFAGTTEYFPVWLEGFLLELAQQLFDMTVEVELLPDLPGASEGSTRIKV